ncbi:hypothetical protein LCGC14_1604260 [marine sediment metagenome]|uniref:NAD(P)-binding domain-containing protein n=1 Tax=marine sediment metagenome TaxID=412755 RepID=A0A0F9IAB2_9ZZZZ
MGLKKLFETFFADKTILITGHTGFIGSWLSICLNELGANLIGYALPPLTTEDNFVVTNLQQKMSSIIGDVRDFNLINNIFKEYQPDIVYHLAAQPIVGESYSNPKDTYDINIGGTVNILEAFRINKNAKILINFTSDKCYENQEKEDGYKEEDRIGGFDPYSSSKGCSELITSAYRNSFFKSGSSAVNKRLSSVRSGNVIGGGDWQKDRLIPDCMRALKNNELLTIRNPQYIRPWQFVLEPIYGMLLLTKNMWHENEKYSGAWNFGPENNRMFTVKDIIEKIGTYIGNFNKKIVFEKKKEDIHETKLLCLDSSKANRELGWQNILSIEETIKFVCGWYMERNPNYGFNVKQIKNYFDKV